MNCDTCKKSLSEDDTHEHILCTSCMTKQSKTHCFICKCDMDSKKNRSRITKFRERVNEFLKKEMPLFTLVVCAILFLDFLAVYFPRVAACFAIGYGVIPTFMSIVYVFCILPYKVGWWINIKYLEGRKDTKEPAFLVWLLGAVFTYSPIYMYLLGSVIYKHLLKG